MRKLSNLVRKFKFFKLDVFLKTRPELEKSNLWQSCEIYLTVHGRSHELEFNVLTNNSLNILGENVVKYILVTITLGKDKGPSACKKQLFL